MRRMGLTIGLLVSTAALAVAAPKKKQSKPKAFRPAETTVAVYDQLYYDNQGLMYQFLMALGTRPKPN